MRNFLLGLALGAAFVTVGTMDFQDSLKDQELYCFMVGSGAWGDYNENYDEVCSAVNPTEERSKEVPSDPVSELPEAGNDGRVLPRQVWGYYSLPRKGTERLSF